MTDTDSDDAEMREIFEKIDAMKTCLLYTSPSPRD